MLMCSIKNAQKSTLKQAGRHSHKGSSAVIKHPFIINLKRMCTYMNLHIERWPTNSTLATLAYGENKKQDKDGLHVYL